MSASYPPHAGSFHYLRDPDSWTWSQGVYALYGLRPGDVVLTTGLLLSHQHVEDRDQVARALEDVLTTGVSRGVWHRVVDMDGLVHQVVSALSAERDGDGGVVGVFGHVVDVTEELRRITSRDVDAAMEALAESRPLIEQAKGALMMRYSVGAEEAFELLRHHSQRSNVKIRDVARRVVDSLAGTGTLGDIEAGLDALADGVWDAPGPVVG